MNYPLQLTFKIIAVNPQISVTDAAGQLLMYVRQKAFKLRESVKVFADASQTRLVATIEADRVIDISASYHIRGADGADIGTVRRRGMRSIWKAHYEVERYGQTVLTIREANPWTKVMDSLLGEVPVLGLLTGYLFHPAYQVMRPSGEVLFRLQKQPALFEGRYALDRVGMGADDEETLAVLSLIMLLLLERTRG